MSNELEVLRGLCHAFGSAQDADEAVEAARRWVRVAIGDAATVTVALPDAYGRLRVIHPEADVPRARGASQRRAAMSRKAPLTLAGDEPGRALVIFPLVSRGESIGVLEIQGDREVIEEQFVSLEAIASQTAIVLRNLSVKTDLMREARASRDAAVLAGELVRATSPASAVDAALRFCHLAFDAKVAAWLVEEDPTEMRLLASRGLGTARKRRLVRDLPAMAHWSHQTFEERERTKELFTSAADTDNVIAVEAGDVLILVGGVSELLEQSVLSVGHILREVLEQVAAVVDAKARMDKLDLGIALTAHEFRGPLVGARAALENLLHAHPHGSREADLLRRSRHELQQLAGVVDALLEWAVGRKVVNREACDVISIVDQAVQSCTFEAESDRVTLTAPDRLLADADPDHLRGAVANIVRNALSYSPGDSEVSVTVEGDHDQVTISVKDHGPGVPEDEQMRIFDPFVRGDWSGGFRSSGLGLFIARRVVEAHEGRIWVRSEGDGAEFFIQIPAAAGAGASRMNMEANV